MICLLQRWFFVGIGLLALMMSRGAQASPVDDQALLLLKQNVASDSLTARIIKQSASLLGQPYLLGALGEGPAGFYDQDPLYRFNAFDCETYVDTVMALALSNTLPSFKQHMNTIRYRHGRVDFFERNHFTSADWVPHNRQKGYIHELTYKIGGQYVKQTAALINRRAWYQHFTLDEIQRPNAPVAEKTFYLQQLKEKSQQRAQNETAHIAYIPIQVFLDHPEISKKIPTGSLILFVRHYGPDIIQHIGTQLNVSHMSLAIWQKGTLYLRMASSRLGRTADIPFQTYLEGYRDSSTMKGLSIWQITAPASHKT
jgi:Protein of unknown function (DUF1460)